MSRTHSLIVVTVIALSLGLIVGQALSSVTSPIRAQAIATPTPVHTPPQESFGSTSTFGSEQPNKVAGPQALPVTPGLLYRSFSGLDFQPYDSRDQLVYDFTFTGRALLTTTASFPAELVAPLQLPQGARISELLFYFRDNSSTNLSVGIVQLPLESGSFSTFMTSTTGISSTAILSASLTVSPTIVVDNSQKAYAVFVALNDFDPKQVIRGIRVGYSVPTVMLPLLLRQ